MPTKEKKNLKIDDKLEKLIDRFETCMIRIDPDDLKNRCTQLLIDMNKTIENLKELHCQLYQLVGLTYGDIEYPST